MVPGSGAALGLGVMPWAVLEVPEVVPRLYPGTTVFDGSLLCARSDRLVFDSPGDAARVGCPYDR